MTLNIVLNRLAQRRSELERLNAQVQGVALLDEIVDLLQNVEMPLATAEPLLTLTAAARQSGFSSDHLGRLVARGDVPNHGRKHAPRLRLSECPRKYGEVAAGGRFIASSRRNGRAS